MTTPAGIWAGPEAMLATMLSVSTPFQTFCGAATPAEALARVHFEGLPDPADAETGEYTLSELETYRPCAIIGTPDRESWSARRVAEHTYRTSGKLLVMFVRSVSGATHGLPSADDVVVYKNLVGPVIGKNAANEDDGILDLPWQSPYLALKDAWLVEGPYTNDAESMQDEGIWIGSTWCVEW